MNKNKSTDSTIIPLNLNLIKNETSEETENNEAFETPEDELEDNSKVPTVSYWRILFIIFEFWNSCLVHKIDNK